MKFDVGTVLWATLAATEARTRPEAATFAVTAIEGEFYSRRRDGRTTDDAPAWVGRGDLPGVAPGNHGARPCVRGTTPIGETWAGCSEQTTR